MVALPSLAFRSLPSGDMFIRWLGWGGGGGGGGGRGELKLEMSFIIFCLVFSFINCLLILYRIV